MDQLPPLHDSALLRVDFIRTRSVGPCECFVRIRHPADRTPAALIKDLEQLGFSAKQGLRTSARDAEFILDMKWPGSGLFGVWTAADREHRQPLVEAVFAAHGLSFTVRSPLDPGCR